ncbi:glycosyl transferase family 2, partial [Halobacteriales archaeon QH_10_67_13]
MPRVSVVVPTYNRATELPRALESVLQQTYRDLELLVVDDGSTDETRSVLAAIDDPRLRVITHETNRGANVARNTGIEHADGELIAFLDSDDEWDRRKLHHQLARYETGPPDCVAVYCGFETELGGVVGRFMSAVARVLATADEERPKEGGEALVGEILADHLHSGAGSTLLVTAAVARDIGGFDEELDRFQDPDFLLR